ncbi:hypothetical protein [Nakamurella leprariae]|uniref:Integral membrane protein n=1 Tax=Nakamurella leprariae TaxID=2803911 RepID=A0A938YBP3_9ACTN|nr:hypothetical protein [Nakamurella leprariae]MBM9469545.1 hypothetical protein [Nakamurella leprariae]
MRAELWRSVDWSGPSALLAAPDGSDPTADDPIVIDILDPVLWLFIGLLVTFVATRLVTRRIRARSNRPMPVDEAAADRGPGTGAAPPPAADGGKGLLRNISFGGVHVHHQVFGILLMLFAGVMLIAATPTGGWLNAVAVIFGVGVSLAFDEFALWLHLEDVYWTPEGRKSVDAIFIVLAVTGVLIGGVDVFPEVGPHWGLPIGITVVLLLAIVCLLKGKISTGLVGIALFPIAIVGAVRLAKPSSWWAHRWYRRRLKARRRAERRFGPAYEARWNRVRDFVAGAPSLPVLVHRTGAHTGPEIGDTVGDMAAPGSTKVPSSPGRPDGQSAS